MPCRPPQRPAPPLRLLAAAAAALGAAQRALATGEAYPWFKRGGNHFNGQVPFVAPSNLSEKPAWVWPNDQDELFRHGPVIDDKLCIYSVSARGWVRKFSPDGDVLWSWQTTPADGKVLTSPFLSEGRLFFSSSGPLAPWSKMLHTVVWSVDMETGEVVWKEEGLEGEVNQDSASIHVSEGVVLGAMLDHERPKDMEGNSRIWAVNASDGSRLWEYDLEEDVVWNFMPATAGDGTFLFATSCGAAHRVRLADGSRVWKSTVAPDPSWKTACSTGGGTLGADGVFYVEASLFGEMPGLSKCIGLGDTCPEGPGILIAYRAADGEILWKRRLGLDGSYMGMQFPALATLAGRPVVVAGIGRNPDPPQWVMGPPWLPFAVRWRLQHLQLRYGFLRTLLGIPVKKNAVAAYDAATGKEVWRFDEEPWDHHSAAGDEEFIWQRGDSLMADARNDPLCGPDNWGIPSVGGDGTVYAASGSTGRLYAIRDADGDGRIGDSEVSTFDTRQGFLNGVALAPGLVAAQPCWGPMYVWRSSRK